MIPRMKITVKEPWRNHGNSWGLEFPIIYGEIHGMSAAWNRHTGEVVYLGLNAKEFSIPLQYTRGATTEDSEP